MLLLFDVGCPDYLTCRHFSVSSLLRNKLAEVGWGATGRHGAPQVGQRRALILGSAEQRWSRLFELTRRFSERLLRAPMPNQALTS